MPGDDTVIGGPAARFPTTCWSRVARLEDPTDDEYRAAVGELAKLYWKPVYAYVRAAWGKSNEEAKDLTQEFFSFVMEKNSLKRAGLREGKFRLLLLTVLKHFLVDEHRRDGRLKRGGAAAVVAIDDAAVPAVDPRAASPEDAFDRAWAKARVGRALDELERSLASQGRGHQARAFRLRYMEGGGGDDEGLASLATQAGRSLSEYKNDLVAARKEFRRIVLSIVGEAVDTEREAEEELTRLMELM
jgi:hypothetical protein